MLHKRDPVIGISPVPRSKFGRACKGFLLHSWNAIIAFLDDERRRYHTGRFGQSLWSRTWKWDTRFNTQVAQGLVSRGVDRSIATLNRRVGCASFGYVERQPQNSFGCQPWLIVREPLSGEVL